MEHRELLLERLSEIGEAVKKTGIGLALIGLGSCGTELNRLDNFSDLDFFVIADAGKKSDFIENLNWLTSIKPLTYIFRNTKDGYKVLFSDGVYCEFAVFEVPELEQAHFTEGRIVWKNDGFDEMLRIPKNTGAPTWKPESAEWLIGEILTCLYVGMARFRRGELLSGYTFVQRHAFTLLLELIGMTEKPSSVQGDVYAQERRFEERFPAYKEQIKKILLGIENTPGSARAILEFIETKFAINPAIKEQILSLL